jgi:membrane-bound lytic murein transglycosylase F
LPYGYARGWEPVLYVNNIRRYYNILKWLTANEEVPESDDPGESIEPLNLPETDEPEESV